MEKAEEKMRELWTDLAGAKAIWVDEEEDVAGVWYGQWVVVLYDMTTGDVMDYISIGGRMDGLPKEHDAWLAFKY